ncbi:protein enabled homolog isoform X2 [Saccostrea cucullata]|uniref:protein enabled homolog isoform X2 n=1 Tax=Saccostrea cuccullata TaxID=36930 RepID=UPI002ED28D18
MSRWNLDDPDFFEEIVPFGSEVDDEEEEEGFLTCTCYGRGKKLSEVDVPRVPQLHLHIEKQKYFEKLRATDDPTSRKVGRGRARIRHKLSNNEKPSVGQSQGLEEQNKAKDSEELLISSSGKEQDLTPLENSEKFKERTKKSHKRPKHIMNCVVSYDKDGNPIISTDDRAGERENKTKKGGIEDSTGQNTNDAEDVIAKRENQDEKHVEIPVKDSNSEDIQKKDENHKKDTLVDKAFKMDTFEQKIENNEQKMKEEQKTNVRPSSKQNHSYKKPPRFIKKELQAQQKMENTCTTIQSSNKPLAETENHSVLRSPKKTSEKEDSVPYLPPSSIASENSSIPNYPVVSVSSLSQTDAVVPPYTSVKSSMSTTPVVSSSSVSHTVVPPYIPLTLPYCPDYSSTYWLQYHMAHGVLNSNTPTSNTNPHTCTQTTISCAPSLQPYQTYQGLSSTGSSAPFVPNPPSSVLGPKESTFNPSVPPPLSAVGPPPSTPNIPPFRYPVNVPPPLSAVGPPPSSPTIPPFRYPINVPPFPQYIQTLQQHAYPQMQTNMPSQNYNLYFLPVACRPLFHPLTRYPCQNQPVSMVGYLINSSAQAGMGNTSRTPPPFCTAVSPDTVRTESLTSGNVRNDNIPPPGNADL